MMTSDKKEKAKQEKVKAGEAQTECERRQAMTWAQRLKRVFNIDVGVFCVTPEKSQLANFSNKISELSNMISVQISLEKFVGLACR